MTKQLVVYENPAPQEVLDFLVAAKQTLEAIESTKEAAIFVKKADSIKYLADKAKASIEVQQEASKVALLAKQKAGELLAKTPLSKGAQGTGSNQYKEVRSPQGTAPTLEDLGINKHESSEWQTLAKVTPKQLETHIDELIEEGEELSTDEAIRYVKKVEGVEPTIRPPSFVGDVYRFIREAQTINNWLRNGVAVKQLWEEADGEETAYLLDQLPKTINLIQQLLNGRFV